MKLELKHLAAYLPYGLEYKYKEETHELKNLHYFYSFDEDGQCVGKTDCTRINEIQTSIAAIKPILRPLKDLTKEIKINGQKFFPINEYFLLFGGGVNAASVINWKNLFIDNIIYTPYESLSYDILVKLFEWHFDVFNLIEKGLAIDFNKV